MRGIRAESGVGATCERLGELFDDLHEASQRFYDRLDEAVPVWRDGSSGTGCG